MELGKIFNEEINLIKYNNTIKDLINDNMFSIYKKCTKTCIIEFKTEELSSNELICLSNCYENIALNRELLNHKLIN